MTFCHPSHKRPEQTTIYKAAWVAKTAPNIYLGLWYYVYGLWPMWLFLSPTEPTTSLVVPTDSDHPPSPGLPIPSLYMAIVTFKSLSKTIHVQIYQQKSYSSFSPIGRVLQSYSFSYESMRTSLLSSSPIVHTMVLWDCPTVILQSHNPIVL